MPFLSSEKRKDIWHHIVRTVARLTFTIAWRVRCYGRENIPEDGGVLVVSNHQSHLDPVLVGLAIDRRMSYLARQSLFTFAPLRWMILSVGAIPLDREGTGLAGLKESLKRLKRQEMLLVFPEGTRSRDGEVAPFKPGFCALARRSKLRLLPVAIDGAFDAWPRTSPFPHFGTVHVHLGKPMTPAEVAALRTDDELVAEVQRRIEVMHTDARQGIERANGNG